MPELLIQQCQICFGWTNGLLVGDRCISCAYTPAGRPTGVGGWQDGMVAPKPVSPSPDDAMPEEMEPPPEEDEIRWSALTPKRRRRARGV